MLEQTHQPDCVPPTPTRAFGSASAVDQILFALVMLALAMLLGGCSGGGEGSGSTADFDGDGIVDAVDSDDDNDGVLDVVDAFPHNAGESLDTDGDGTGNNADPDDDGDGVLDGADSVPLDGQQCADSDADGCDDCAVTGGSGSGADPANDGVDTDGDGQCNASDTDQDNDGVPNATDSDPLDAFVCRDLDTDGCDDCAVTGGDLSGGDVANDGTDSNSDGQCDPSGLILTVVPMAGIEGSDWVMRNYYDLDDLPNETRDYAGFEDDLAKTYDGHKGIDFSLANFRDMDAGHDVLAAADGVVTQVVDGNFDRQVSFVENCGSVVNFVRIEHADGWETDYLHFKRDSIVVSVGQQVSAGDVLGQAGSSGCSSWPHLHLTVRDPQGGRHEPFLDGRWVDPPEYQTPIGLMDVLFKAGAFANSAEIRDFGTDQLTHNVGNEIGVAVVIAGGVANDQIQIELREEDGTVAATMTGNFVKHGTRTLWWWTRTLSGTPGMWSAHVMLNGVEVRVVEIEVQ